MKVFYYSIKDEDAKEFGPMFQAKNDALAVRATKQVLKDVPEDVKPSYHLFCLFEFDTEIGQLSFPFDQYEVPLTNQEVVANVNN